MTLRNELPVSSRPHRSEFDHRAINVTCRLLLGIVSLERRIGSIPKQLSALVEEAGQSASTDRPLGSIAARVTGDEE
jgi:hypothetical protein